PGEIAKRLRGRRHKFGHSGSPIEALSCLFKPRQQRRGKLRTGRWLKLDETFVTSPRDADVERFVSKRRHDMPEKRHVSCESGGCRILSQKRLQRRILPVRDAKPAFDVSGDMEHLLGGSIRHKKQTMRLDRSWNVNRLAVAMQGHSTSPQRTRSAKRKPRAAPRHMRSSAAGSRAPSRSRTPINDRHIDPATEP